MKALLARPAGVFLILFVLALANRASTLGHPLLHLDETFYLLVGDRALNSGLWPYIDIWDRKPAGLFALYAFIRVLGGEGLIQYQLVACFFVAGTCFFIQNSAQRVAGAAAGWLAACFYIAWLPLYGGYGGQAPVFYNLLVAAAGYTVLRLLDNSAASQRLFRGGLLAMLLLGLALTIKTSVVFEGIYLGLILCGRAMKQNARRLLPYALGWAGIALIPTAVIVLTYLLRGSFEPFFHANVTSILARKAAFTPAAAERLLNLMGLCAPLMLLALGTLRGAMTPGIRMLLGWCAVALAAVLLFGTYYLHYGLPLLVPMSIAGAIGLARFGMKGRWALLLCAVALIGSGVHLARKVSQRPERAELDAVLTILESHPGPCPYFSGQSAPILYHLSGACLPTRFPISGHLFEAHEASAIGIDQRAELERILAARPRIITFPAEPGTEDSPALRAEFMQRVHREYLQVAHLPMGKSAVLMFVPKAHAQPR